MPSALRSPRPVLLATADVAFGGVLFVNVSPLIGLLVVAAGVLLLCGVAHETLRSRPGADRTGRRTPVASDR